MPPPTELTARLRRARPGHPRRKMRVNLFVDAVQTAFAEHAAAERARGSHTRKDRRRAAAERTSEETNPKAVASRSRDPSTCDQAPHRIRKSIQKASYPRPRHGGGMGRRPLNPTSPLGRRWSRAFPLPTPFFLRGVPRRVGASKMAQDGSKSEKARKHKTLIFLRFWKDFGLLGGPKRRLEAL